MAKKIVKRVSGVLMLLAGIAVAGLFLDGSTLANPILGFIPEIVHTIAGWSLVVVSALEGWKAVK